MAVLSSASRKKMPKKEFALPGKKSGGKGGYPIPDASHGRNALARVSEFGSSSEKATVRAKVHAKFPGIGKTIHGGKDLISTSSMKGKALSSDRASNLAIKKEFKGCGDWACGE